MLLERFRSDSGTITVGNNLERFNTPTMQHFGGQCKECRTAKQGNRRPDCGVVNVRLSATPRKNMVATNDFLCAGI